MSITPIPAWRDYHEYVARIEQDRDVVAELVRFAEPAGAPGFLASTASRQAGAVPGPCGNRRWPMADGGQRWPM